MLTFGVLMVKGDPFASAACFYSLVMGTGNISGSNFNPAASIALIVVELLNKRSKMIPTYLAYILM